jgi:hypothetical protein
MSFKLSTIEPSFIKTISSWSDTKCSLITNLGQQLRGMSAGLENATSKIQAKNSELSKMDKEAAEEANKANEAAASYECKYKSLTTGEKNFNHMLMISKGISGLLAQPSMKWLLRNSSLLRLH